ncbi:hypothetical protein [Prosthecobacter sp.]|uniref:hypothetical protein n=1 Tax=Prosthecobacter sp. TaxID=1965333 RepID=UPI0037852C85
MSYHAIIHELSTGRFLLQCDVEAHDLHEAENAAISKAALATKAHPSDMDVRHLHERAERAFSWAADAQPYHFSSSMSLRHAAG